MKLELKYATPGSAIESKNAFWIIELHVQDVLPADLNTNKKTKLLIRVLLGIHVLHGKNPGL